MERPAIIGYKGSITAHQENTLEGMKDVIKKGYQGIHMQVQMTRDDKMILFGDKNFLVIMLTAFWVLFKMNVIQFPHESIKTVPRLIVLIPIIFC